MEGVCTSAIKLE